MTINSDSVQHKPNLVLDLLDDALALKELFGDYFPAPKPGVYISGNPEPAIPVVDPNVPMGMFCYKLVKGAQGASVPSQIVTFEDITSTVYNVDAEILIPKEVAVRRLLSTEPTLPFIQAQLIKAVAFNAMQQNVKWYKGPKTTTREIILEVLRPQIHPASKEDDLIALCDEIQEYTYNTERIVSEFLKGYAWSLYDIQLRGMDLWVVRGEDFRVKDWERRMKSGEWQ